MRSKLFKIIESDIEHSLASSIYDIFMIICILTSIIPLAFKTDYMVFDTIETITVIIFIIDYLLRWVTADFKVQKGKLSFLLYPITPMAIVDLLSILPGFTLLNSGFKLLRILRFLRALRVLRTLKMVRYSKSIQIVITVFKKERKILSTVLIIALAYIFLTALIVITVEPDSFDNYFEAIYWATVSLTTVGYGDVYPISSIGRIIAMVSSFFGIAVIALPAGIITAGFMAELSASKEERADLAYIEELRQLKALLNDEIITQEEFENKKKQILGV